MTGCTLISRPETMDTKERAKDGYTALSYPGRNSSQGSKGANSNSSLEKAVTRIYGDDQTDQNSSSSTVKSDNRLELGASLEALLLPAV